MPQLIDDPLSRPNVLEETKNSNDFKSLIELLEFEITHVRSEEARPGWTTWALLGGLATMLWLLTREFEQHQVNTDDALFLFLILALTYDSVRMIINALSKPMPLRNGRFISFSIHFSQDRSLMLFMLIRSAMLLVIASQTQLFVGKTFQILTVLFYGFDLFATLGAFVLTYTQFAVPVPPKGSRVVVVFRITVIAGGMLAALVCISVLYKKPNFSIFEYRISGLVFGISVLLSILARSHRRMPLLETLVGIRRSLALGQLDLDSAQRQTEIALQGMTASDALQSQLVSLLADLERGGIHLEAASKEFEAFLTTLKSHGSEGSQAKDTLINVLIQSVNRHRQEVKTALESFAAKRDKLHSRMYAYRRISPEVESSLLLLRRKLDDASETFNSKGRMLNERAAEFERMLTSAQTENLGPNKRVAGPLREDGQSQTE